VTNSDAVIVKQDGPIGRITFNKPERYNSFDATMLETIHAALQEFGHNPEIGVVVFTGAGDKAFCAGGYLKDLTEFDAVQARKLYDASWAVFSAMRRIPQPVIAAVQGFAIGGGNEFVICSDLAIASDNARFGQTGPKVGSVPVYGGTNLLPLTIGEKKAREVVYLCRQYTAQEALELGWINKVVPQDQLAAEVDSWCEELLGRSPSYLELAKVMSNIWWDVATTGMEHAKQAMLRLAGGPEMTEGASAFMEKRKPDFQQFRRASGPR
jgi:1,4-dihydroxy-2-naphthoyl-CoA synthase